MLLATSMSGQSGDGKDGDFEYNQRTAKKVMKDHGLTQKDALIDEAKHHDANEDKFLNRKELESAAEAINAGESKADGGAATAEDIAKYAPKDDGAEVPCPISGCSAMVPGNAGFCPSCGESFN